MFISKKHLPRRTFLRAAGASISLPLLDAMIPAGTALAQTAAAPAPNYGFFYFPHGAVMDHWTPTAAGADFDLPRILAPLADFQNQMTIVSNLRNRGPEGGGVHVLNPGTWLSGTAPGERPEDPLSGVTIDQIAAQRLRGNTPFPSLELCTEVRGSANGGCNPEYGCGYGSTISRRTATQPLPMEHNPRKLFYRLFGQGDTADEREAIIAQTGSLLDLVLESAGDLRGEIGVADRVRVEEYLDSVREIERQVQMLADQDFSDLDLPDAPAGVPQDWEVHINMMFDLAALAYQSGLTRVVSMMMAAEISMLTYNQIGISEAFHPLSHHQNDASKLERLTQLQTYHSRLFARFLERLGNTPDGDGSLLDHSILLYGSNMSNSNLHNANPLPTAVFGHASGRIAGNRHIVMPPDTPLANLLHSLLDRGGIELPAIGDSTGTIDLA